MDYPEAQVGFEEFEVAVAVQKSVSILDAERRDYAIDSTSDGVAARAKYTAVPG